MTTKKHINIVFPICFQDDFIGPKGLDTDKHILERNLALHGGYKLSNRILGSSTDDTNPLQNILTAIHADEKTYVLYIEDQHEDDEADPKIKDHFTFFGRHCVVGSEGSKPVAGISVLQSQRRSQVIATDALNLVTLPSVVEAVKAIIQENDIDNPLQIKFLVMGGLTDILVADLAKSLNHICGIPNPYREGGENWTFFGRVGVTERYSFSNINSHHVAALQSMAKIAINILKTDQAIFEFLGIDA